MINKLARFGREFRNWVAQGEYEASEGGVLINKSAMLRGTYSLFVNNEQVDEFHNLIPTEGIAFILDVALGDTAKAAGFYLAPFANGVNPAANWTAASFAATAGEITSQVEGYSEATRPEWAVTTSAAGVIGNLASKAAFSIVCTSTLNISGMALLTSNVRGGTSGALISASRYPSVRVVNNGDGFSVGYTVSLTDS
jgi:hypothetical protein